MNEKSKQAPVLDWARLLGFDQVRNTTQSGGHTLRDARLAKVGVKVGVKTGLQA